MKALTTMLIVALVLAAQALYAQPEDDLGNGMDDEWEEFKMARIVSGQSHPKDCLAAIAINRIDGEPRVVPAQGFLIEPGIHSVNGLAILDITHCSIAGDERQINTAADLEVNFEAGQTYYIGYDHKSRISDERQLVVWKVEHSNPFEILF